MAEDLFIIAIELGSSHATGIGGKKMPDGSIQIEAVAQEPSSAFIRKGMIFNMDKSTQCVRVIKKSLCWFWRTKPALNTQLHHAAL